MVSKEGARITAVDVGKLSEVAGLKVRAEKLEALTARYLGFLAELEKLKEPDINNQEPAVIFTAGENLP